MLIHRILTAALLLPLFLAAMFFLPRTAWGVVVLLVVLLASSEWAKLANLKRTGSIALVLAVALGCAVLGAGRWPFASMAILAGAVLFWIVVVPLWLKRSNPVSPTAAAVSGWIVLVSSWYAVVLLQETPLRLLALISVVWIADTAAYFAGRRFGRRKLAPAISPGKTWEGVIGAGVAVAVYYSLLWIIVAPAQLAEHRALDGLLVAVMLVLSVEGDLFESWMKRRAGVKDSGTILPGHGGVLDRIDGVIAALPAAALLALVTRG